MGALFSGGVGIVAVLLGRALRLGDRKPATGPKGAAAAD